MNPLRCTLCTITDIFCATVMNREMSFFFFFTTQQTHNQQQNDDNPAHNYRQVTTQQTRHDTTAQHCTALHCRYTHSPHHTPHHHFLCSSNTLSRERSSFSIPLHSTWLDACTEHLDKFFLRGASNSPTNKWAKPRTLALRDVRTGEREPTELVIVVTVIEHRKREPTGDRERRAKRAGHRDEQRETHEKRERPMRRERETDFAQVGDPPSGLSFRSTFLPLKVCLC